MWRYQKRDTVFDRYELGNIYLKLDVWCSEEEYKVYFWHGNRDTTYDIKADFDNIDLFNDWEYSDNRYSIMKTFKAFEEEALFDFIDSLLVILKNKKEKEVQSHKSDKTL